MVTNAQLINRTLGQAVIYLNQKALSVGVTSPDLSVIIIFFKSRLYLHLLNNFLPFICQHYSSLPPFIHIKTEQSPLEFLTMLHNGKAATKSRFYILVIVPLQTHMESLVKEAVLELALRMKR